MEFDNPASQIAQKARNLNVTFGIFTKILRRHFGSFLRHERRKIAHLAIQIFGFCRRQIYAKNAHFYFLNYQKLCNI